jgi:hypothetical protein
VLLLLMLTRSREKLTIACDSDQRSVSNATLPLFNNYYENVFRLSRPCYVPHPSHCANVSCRHLVFKFAAATEGMVV